MCVISTETLCVHNGRLDQQHQCISLTQNHSGHNCFLHITFIIERKLKELVYKQCSLQFHVLVLGVGVVTV